MSIGSPYLWYQIDTAPTHPRVSYDLCSQHKVTSNGFITHNAGGSRHCRVVWSTMQSARSRCFRCESTSIMKRLFWVIITFPHCECGGLYSVFTAESLVMFLLMACSFSFAFLYSVFILIFSIKNICTVSLLSIKRHAVLGHFYLTFIPLCIYYLYGWNLFNIVCIWIFLSVRCVINFETGLYVTSTVTCWFSRWPILPTSK